MPKAKATKRPRSTKKTARPRKGARASKSKKGKAARPAADPLGKPLGIVTGYFAHVRAAVLKLKGPLALGDAIWIKGHTTDLKQTVNSLQMDCQPITSAKRGQEIGLQVNDRARRGDRVYKL